MSSKAGNLLFRFGLALNLISICLSSYVMARAQTGPSWEVPVAVTTELAIIPVMSTLLAICALLLYFWSRRFGKVGAAAHSGFWVVTLITLALPVIIWTFQPAQWPYRFVTLSFFATILIVPAVIGSLVGFWLIGFRWLRAG